MEELKYDIAIIGGGIVGLATAYQIQKEFPKIKSNYFRKKKAKLCFSSDRKKFWSYSFRTLLQARFSPCKNCVKGREQLLNLLKK